MDNGYSRILAQELVNCLSVLRVLSFLAEIRLQVMFYSVGRFLNAWLNVCVSGNKGKLRV